jgi:hypothetical protein
MRKSFKLAQYAPPLILALSLLSVYLNSMAAGLTWANDGVDGGDLITAAATGGVAHPTGYPVYLFLARLFQLLPVGSLAFRTNLMSALAVTAAALLVYDLVIRFLSYPDENKHQNWLAGLISAYAFGLSPLIWSQAVITEVYALHALFVTLILYLASDESSRPYKKKNSDRLLGLVFGLAMGNHITTMLLAPVLLPSRLFHISCLTGRETNERKHGSDIHSFLRQLTWLGIGLLSYLALPLRALSHPPVNWGNPLTLDKFAWLVSGHLYQDQLFGFDPPSIWLRVQGGTALLIEQFGIPGLIIGLIGLIVFYKPSRLYKDTIWVVIAFFVFSIVYASRDSYMYLIPVFLCFAIWVGFGMGGLMAEMMVRFRHVGVVSGFVFIIYLFVLAGTHWRQVDASRDFRAERFGAEVVALAPMNSIVFAKGDKAVFTMWYFHYALRNRPDLVVVATDLLPFDWYQETLHANYPDLVLPYHFPSTQQLMMLNLDRPTCYIEYIQITDINCLTANDP